MPNNTEVVVESVLNASEWSPHIPPMPTLFMQLASAYRLTGDLRKELRFWLKLCFSVDAVMDPKHREQASVAHLFMLSMMFSRIGYAKKCGSNVLNLNMQREEIGLLYKFFLFKVRKEGLGIYGSDSALIIAINERILQEGRMMGDPRIALSVMALPRMWNSTRKNLSLLLAWADIVDLKSGWWHADENLLGDLVESDE